MNVNTKRERIGKLTINKESNVLKRTCTLYTNKNITNYMNVNTKRERIGIWPTIERKISIFVRKLIGHWDLH